jgi:hypothetical protein
MVRSLRGGALGATGCYAFLRGGEVCGRHLGALGSCDTVGQFGLGLSMVLYWGNAIA